MRGCHGARHSAGRGIGQGQGRCRHCDLAVLYAGALAPAGMTAVGNGYAGPGVPGMVPSCTFLMASSAGRSMAFKRMTGRLDPWCGRQRPLSMRSRRLRWHVHRRHRGARAIQDQGCTQQDPQQEETRAHDGLEFMAKTMRTWRSQRMDSSLLPVRSSTHAPPAHRFSRRHSRCSAKLSHSITEPY